jgi:transposase
MRTGVTVEVSEADRQRLAAIVSDRNSRQKHVWRANIVLLTAAGCGTAEIMRRARVSKTAVWRWQERFMTAGVDGLLRDKTRPSRIPSLEPKIERRVVARTLEDPPGETTHWTAPLLAAEVGISVSSVQRIWRRHGLQPHRTRQFKLSNDPRFAEKLREIVGLYVNPPEDAVVLSVDEKSQIQALDRTQPGLPMKPGRCGTMTHDYQRRGTTTLFAALNVLDGKVIGRCMQRHRHQEFIRFLNAIEASIPTDKQIHVIADNSATHKHPKVREWLARHPRWTCHFTPTSASWLNAVEGFFAKLTRRRLKRGVFRSVMELQAAIKRFLAEANENPRPFRWTKDPDKIIAAVRRGHQVLDSHHLEAQPGRSGPSDCAIGHMGSDQRVLILRPAQGSSTAWPYAATSGHGSQAVQPFCVSPEAAAARNRPSADPRASMQNPTLCHSLKPSRRSKKFVKRSVRA